MPYSLLVCLSCLELLVIARAAREIAKAVYNKPDPSEEEIKVYMRKGLLDLVWERLTCNEPLKPPDDSGSIYTASLIDPVPFHMPFSRAYCLCDSLAHIALALLKDDPDGWSR